MVNTKKTSKINLSLQWPRTATSLSKSINLCLKTVLSEVCVFTKWGKGKTKLIAEPTKSTREVKFTTSFIKLENRSDRKHGEEICSSYLCLFIWHMELEVYIMAASVLWRWQFPYIDMPISKLTHSRLNSAVLVAPQGTILNGKKTEQSLVGEWQGDFQEIWMYRKHLWYLKCFTFYNVFINTPKDWPVRCRVWQPSVRPSCVDCTCWGYSGHCGNQKQTPEQ